MPALPTGTVTFLFTDIEGSTRLWEQQPEAMPAALAEHDALLRQAVAAEGGQIVKTTGDGLHAVFAGAGAGAAAALAAQRRLQAPLNGVALKVRMGLHTGEAALREGDYYGPALNRAARLMALAAGGQILLSAATADLLRDQLPEGAALRDLGEHRLKDLTRPEHICQLDGEGLPGSFPRLPSLDVQRHNLPAQLTSFIGRERELAEVTQLLSVTHLLTLTGPGGTGKTRLSLQVAAEVLDDFPAGAWLVELAPLTDPSLVVPAVAAALEVREQPGRELLDTLLDYLRARCLLLILDNCEHLVDACARAAAALLRGCPELKILASSREVLGVVGETVYRVPSLSCADLRPAPGAQPVSDAARLFVERARAARPDFALAPGNHEAVDQICLRLDGIPLAIELAAARLKLLTAEQIAARLDDRFRLLTGGSRTALPRQQTLRALIDWSYDLLSEPERAALRRLSVFAGGWTLEAAEVLLGPEALDLLGHFADKSLVSVGEASGAARYRLLETVRQYAREKLSEAGEAAAARDEHFAYYLQLAAAAGPRLFGPDMLAALSLLEAELDNLRAALEWSAPRDPESALRLAAALGPLSRRGFMHELRRWLDDLCARVETLPPAEGEAARSRQTVQAEGLWAAGALTFQMGENESARRKLEASAALARASGHSLVLARGLSHLVFVGGWLGDLDLMQRAIEEGLPLSQALGDKWSTVGFLGGRANLAQLQGDFAAAEAYAAEAARAARQESNPWQSAVMIMGAGIGAAARGQLDEARALLAESAALFRDMNERQFAVAVRSQQAHIERQRGNYVQAAVMYAETLRQFLDMGHRAAVAHELECLAFIALAQSAPERAARLLGAAEALRASAASPMTAQERGEYDQQLAALRARLEPAVFEQAWSEGRRLTMEQAAALALEPHAA